MKWQTPADGDRILSFSCEIVPCNICPRVVGVHYTRRGKYAAYTAHTDQLRTVLQTNQLGAETAVSAASPAPAAGTVAAVTPERKQHFLNLVEKAAQRDGRRPHRHSLADVKDYLKESGTPHQQELAVRRPEAYPVEWEEEMEETRAKDDSPENAAMVRE